MRPAPWDPSSSRMPSSARRASTTGSGAADLAMERGLEAHQWADRISRRRPGRGADGRSECVGGRDTPRPAARACGPYSGASSCILPKGPPGARARDVQLLLADAHLARGSDQAAEGALLAGIHAMEQGRTSLHDVALQLSFFEQALPLFDDMVRLQLDQRHDPEQALAFVERGRARQMVDTLAGQPAAPVRAPGPEAGATRWPRPRVLRGPRGPALRLGALPRRVPFRRAPAEGGPVVAAGGRPSGGPGGARASVEVVHQTAARLYDELLLPLTPLIAPERALVFIPDGILQGVAFAGLWNRQTKRYLVEDYVLGLAPERDGLRAGLSPCGDPERRRAARPRGRQSPGRSKAVGRSAQSSGGRGGGEDDRCSLRSGPAPHRHRGDEDRVPSGSRREHRRAFRGPCRGQRRCPLVGSPLLRP